MSDAAWLFFVSYFSGMKNFVELSYPISSWAEEDRPREKLRLRGRAALTDSELLAILLGSGTTNESAVSLAKRILNSVDGLRALGGLTVDDLMEFKGIGEAKAIGIVAALELGRRRGSELPIRKPKIASSRDVFDLMLPHLMDLNYEEFWAVYLNRANKVVAKRQISKGGVTGTVADPKLIFKEALLHTACGLILVHNHPSGNLSPSEADKKLTQKMASAGSFMDIAVIDHLIITDEGYFSFADEGLL
jgi:DNA repair protein RadC